MLNDVKKKEKVYIAGAITGFSGFAEKFAKAEKELKAQGYAVMNPAVVGPGFTQEEYMHVCYAMIDTCDIIYFLNNWKNSVGANKEYKYGEIYEKKFIFEPEEDKHGKELR